MPSIKDRLSSSRSQKDLTEVRAMFFAVQADLAALRAKHNALPAKLHAVGTLNTLP